MIKKIVDCALPGLATILGGTAVCLVMTAGAHASPHYSGQFSDFPIQEQQFATDLSPIAFTPSTTRRHIAQANPGANQSSSSIIVLDLPKVADYWVSATRQSGGTIIFDGYAPNKSTRDALKAHKGADTQYLKLASGASGQYQAALDFGLSILDQLDEGRFALRDNVVTFTGTASSDVNYTAVSEALTKLPHGLVLARAEILPPIADAYQWTATKASTGAIALTGMAPSPDAERAMLASAGAGATETLSFASGEPDDFLASTQIGLSLLKAMSDGRVSFDGNGWIVSGTARSLADKSKLEADFAEKQLAASGWSLAVGEPLNAVAQVAEPTPAAPATPTAAPIDPNYSFTATKSADGKIALDGQIPADPARRYFGAVTKADIASVTVAPGAPADFIPSAEAGIRALMLLPEAQLAFANGKWTLSGTATDAANRDAAQAVIPANQSAWTVSLSLPAAPEPVAVATAPVVPATVPTPEEVSPAVTPPASETESATTPVPAISASTATPVAPLAQPTSTTAVAATSSADVAACTAPLADFSARNAILFRSGAAVIADDSAPALDELATDLSACPDAVVHIEGHTDGDGDDQRNLALSVARAEAVVNALVQRGVTPARLYAVGYGEAKPIADNDTPEGKRLNRRIVVTVSAEHY